jgi:hypothetical protein
MNLTLITKDGETHDRNLVQVRLGCRQADPITSLLDLDTQLSNLRTSRDTTEVEIKRLEILRSDVEALANRVQLKKL